MSTLRQFPEKQLLDIGYGQNVVKDKTIPNEIINMICLFLQIIFHCDIIDKRYGTNDTIQLKQAQERFNHKAKVLVFAITINSGSINAGIADGNKPEICIPNINTKNRDNGKILIGHEVKDKFLINASSPIQSGEIDDWDGFRAIMLRLFSQIIDHNSKKDETSKLPFAVIMSECNTFSKESRERLTKFMFEENGVVGFLLYSRSVLALCASGRTTGVVVCSDYHCTEIVPI